MLLIMMNNVVMGALNNDSPTALPYFNDLTIQTLHPATRSFRFDTLANHPDVNFLINENSILQPSGVSGEFYEYKIKMIEDTNINGKAIRSVYCESVAIMELLGHVVNPMSLPVATLPTMMSAILAGSNWQMASAGDSTAINSIEFTTHTNALYAIRQVLELFSMEVDFTVSLQNNRIFESNVHITSRIGAEDGVRFVYGENLIGARRTRDTYSLMTSCVGIGAQNPNGTHITLNDLVLPPGQTVQSILGNPDVFREGRMLVSQTSFEQHSVEGRHITGVFEDSSIVSPLDLLHATYNYFIDKTRPKTTYQVDVVLLHQLEQYAHNEVRLGDTVIIQDMTLNPFILVEARVVELEISETSPENSRATIGDFVSINIGDRSEIEMIKYRINNGINSHRIRTNFLDCHQVTTSSNIFANGESGTRMGANGVGSMTATNFHVRYNNAWRVAATNLGAQVNGTITSTNLKPVDGVSYFSMTNALDIVKETDMVRYKHSDDENGVELVAESAHDLIRREALDEDGNVLDAVDLIGTIGLLWESVKELSRELEELKPTKSQ